MFDRDEERLLGHIVSWQCVNAFDPRIMPKFLEGIRFNKSIRLDPSAFEYMVQPTLDSNYRCKETKKHIKRVLIGDGCFVDRRIYRLKGAARFRYVVRNHVLVALKTTLMLKLMLSGN